VMIFELHRPAEGVRFVKSAKYSFPESSLPPPPLVGSSAVGRPDAAASAAGRLLDGLEAAHKSDVREFTVGHLNESRLYKPPEPPRRNRLLERADGAGSPNGAVGSTDTSGVRCDGISSSNLRAPQQPELHREALVEEILPPTAPPQRFLAPEATAATRPIIVGPSWCGKRVVREQDTTEQDLMSGYGAVRDLELRLQENLRIHFGNSTGPVFHAACSCTQPLLKRLSGSLILRPTTTTWPGCWTELRAALSTGHLRAQLDPAARSAGSRARRARRLQDRLAAALKSDAELALAGLSDSRQRLADRPRPPTWLRRSADRLPKSSSSWRPRSNGSAAGGSQEETSADRCERLLREIWAGLDSLARAEARLRANQSPLVCAAHWSAAAGSGARRDADSGGGARQAGQANQAGVDELSAAMARQPNSGCCEDVLDDSDLSRAMRLLSYDCAAAAAGQRDSLTCPTTSERRRLEKNGT
uniref:VASt domain-containing protein n=1 Tax=Macrostomum lignano TaxID=282301 RepID=A0A1I8FM85_9PLAT